MGAIAAHDSRHGRERPARAGAAGPHAFRSPCTTPRNAASTGDAACDALPGADGLVVYLSVAHVFGDYFPVTVPWASIADVLAPGMQEKLTT